MLRRRAFSTFRSLRNAEHGTVPPIKNAPQHFNAVPVPPPKPRHRFRNTLLTLGVAAAGLYGAGGYYSIQSDRVYDYFTGYVPGAVPVVEFFEDHLFSRPAAPAYGKPSEPSRAVPVLKPEIKKKVQEIPKKVEAKKAEIKETAKEKAAAAQQKVQASLSSLSGHHVDPSLEPVVEAANKWITSINVGRMSDNDVNNFLEALQDASAKLDKTRRDFEENLQLKLKEQGQALSKELDSARERLVALYNERLASEVEASREVALAEANNRIRAQFLNIYNEISGKVKAHVDAEREGRLANLDKLNKELSGLQKLATSEGSAIADNDSVVSFMTDLAQFRSALAGEATDLRPIVKKLQSDLPEDPLVKAASEAIILDNSNGGVLSVSQLAARFKLIAPEIRNASLVPPDAGVAGHLASTVISKLLVKKDGLPVGDDVESILARTETYLSQGDVYNAVAEVNSLKGWPKYIASDWLKEGRKRSEVEFLAKVLADEGKLHSVSQA